MNKHIELVKKWLADPDSVTTEELKANADAADAVYYAAGDAAARDAAHAERAARDAAYDAYYAEQYAATAEFYIEKYEELTEGE